MNCLQAITRALRHLRVVPAGTSPSAGMSSTALEALQDQLLSLPGATWWKDVLVDGDYEASEGERVTYSGEDTITVTIPAAVSSAHSLLYCCDQYELVCTGYDDRTPKDGARVQVAAADGATTYMYRADLGAWKAVSGLALTDELPINADFHDGFCAMLAVRLAPEFGRELHPVVVAQATATALRMRARYRKRQGIGVDPVLLRTSSNPYGYDPS